MADETEQEKDQESIERATDKAVDAVNKEWGK